MELPISTIVIIVIVLVVLLAIIAFFFGVWDPGVGGISLEATKNNACQMLVSTGCSNSGDIVVNGFDANKDGELKTGRDWRWNSADCGKITIYGDNLAALCNCYYGIPDDPTCRKTICNCE